MSDDDDYDFNRSRGNRGRGNRGRRGAPNLRDSLKEIKSGFQSGVLMLALAAIAFLCYTSFYRVDASDQGLVLRFGEHVRTVEPGLQLKLPWPIESVYTVPIRRVQTEEFGFRTASAGRTTVRAKNTKANLDVADMLTGDLNLAHVEWIVQYKINDPFASLFNVGGDDSGWEGLSRLTQSGINPAIPDTIQDVSETVMRKLVGDRSVDAVLTMGREEIASQAKLDIQKMLDEFEVGVDVITVKLQTTSPPEKVKDAFQKVNSARQNKEKVINEAEGERNRKVPAARGKGEQLISEAEGYKSRMTLETQGSISAFNAKLLEYEKAPEVTKQRLYLEAMQEVLGNVGQKTIIDESVNQMLPILNLNGDRPQNPLRGQR